jgi:hypothetical protein
MPSNLASLVLSFPSLLGRTVVDMANIPEVCECSLEVSQVSVAAPEAAH